jgi:hypothetical protein
MTAPALAAQIPPAPPLSPALREWVGTWSGSAKLTNEAAGASCAYEGAANPPAVALAITAVGAGLQGNLKLSFPAPAGSACPAIEKAADLRDLVASGSSLTFSGPGKHAWTLGRRGQEMLGTVAWKGTVGEEAGALRLSGEVKLEKGGAHRGNALLAVGGIVAANVVGIGIFGLANKAGKTKDNGPPQVSCSPRQCFLISLTEPCQCNTTLTSGAVCGTTTAGVGYAGVCNVDGSLPCQAGLSCNSGLCEDRFGHCPF